MKRPTPKKWVKDLPDEKRQALKQLSFEYESALFLADDAQAADILAAAATLIFTDVTFQISRRAGGRFFNAGVSSLTPFVKASTEDESPFTAFTHALATMTTLYFNTFKHDNTDLFNKPTHAII